MSSTNGSLLCPITLALFRDPVLAEDGHTYERQAIIEWIQAHARSPITDQPLSLARLYPNYTIKKAVNHFERSLQKKNYQYILGVDVKKKAGRPLFQTFGKTIYWAEWLPTSENRPEIILLKIDGAVAQKEASFYVDLSRHPRIVRIYGLVHEKCDNDDDDDAANNASMLLQEHAPMRSLYDLLQEQRKAPDEKILVEIFLQIVDGMIFLASNNVVHADLACRNILVFRFDEKDSRNNVVKITNFGLSRHGKLYSLAPSAAKITLNIVPVRYVAPEILLPNVTREDYAEKSDVFSMGVLMWEAYSRGAVPWAKISDDNEVIRRVVNGERLSKPSNCSEACWSIICKTWAKLPSDRPTFAELKHLLAQQSYHASVTPSNTMPLTIALSNTSEEFKSVENQFLADWPSEFRSQIRVEAVHKIHNPFLESQYQQFVRSSAQFASQEYIGWHATSAKCDNGHCVSPQCTLCQLVRNGFRKECARKDTRSYLCWGNAVYFASQSFVCQTHNGASEINGSSARRCTIMTKINRGCTVRGETLIKALHSQLPLAELIARMSYDTVIVSRDCYIAPTEYILLYNNVAALPIYIVVYSTRTSSLQVRKTGADYCLFHNEYHGSDGSCDGHWGPGGAGECLTPDSDDYNGISRQNPYELHLKDWYVSGGGQQHMLETIKQLKPASS